MNTNTITKFNSLIENIPDKHVVEKLDDKYRRVIANEFTEADRTVYLSALIELGLVLFLVTVIINIIGKAIIKRFSNE